MKTIRGISAQNLKGQTFRHELAPVTLFTGDNFSGKTSRLDAVHLALLGWLPGIGKRGSDIYADLASGSTLSVSAFFDVTKIEREWAMVKGSVKYTGPDGGWPPVSLVASEFLSLSPAERVKFLFARAKLPSEYSVQSLVKTITANIKNIKLEQNTAASEAVIDQTCNLVADLLNGEPTPQEFVSGVAHVLSEKKKLAVQAVQRMEKTQQGMAVIAPDIMAEADAEAKLRQAQETYTAQRSVLAQVEADGKRLAAELEGLKRLAVDAMPDSGEARQELQRLTELKRTLTLSLGERPDTQKLTAEFSRLTTEVAQANSKRDKSAERLESATKQRDSLKANKNPCCAACGQSLKKLRESLLEAAEKAVVDAYSDHSRNKVEAVGIGAELTALNKKRKQLDDDLVGFNMREKELKLVSEKHSALERKLANNSEAIKAAMEVSTIEAELVQLRERFKAGNESVNLKAVDVQTANDAYKQLVAERSRCQQQQAALDELRRSRIEAEVLKATVSLLLELQALLVDVAVAPLISKANQLCGDLLVAPLAYKDGDIGFTDRGSFYSHRSFSGTEKALAYAAISVALAQDAPMRLVVIDELGRLTPDNKMRLIAKLCELTSSGQLDQALLVDVTPIDGFASTQFKLIKL